MHGASPLELRSYLVIEFVVGRFHIGKQCIPAHVWHFNRTKDRTERRFIAPSHVGVPNIYFRRPLSIIIEVNNLRVRLAVSRERMDLKVTKAPGEGDVLSLRNRLISKEDYLPFNQ